METIAPVIISASRSTDIPAFYARWFFNRLEEGYCVWYNPFNQRPVRVSFENCRVVVFWTKNPAPILPYLHLLEARGIHYYFQVTLNDYENEGFEPNLPPLAQRIETFRELASRIGKARVIWRFDPLVVSRQLTPGDLLRRIRYIGNHLKGFTEKLVFSFVDVAAYRKVQNNLIRETPYYTKEDVVAAEMDLHQRLGMVEGLVRLRDIWKSEGWDIVLATCGEDEDFAKYGIEHNRCIDGELMERVFSGDKELVYYLHTGKWPEPDLFGEMPPFPEKRKNLKDKGQRKACGCMVSKDIGMYNTCPHLCAYCYANTSRERVLSNYEKHSINGESIVSARHKADDRISK